MTFLSHSVRDFRLKMMRDLMKRDRLDALIFTTADFFQFATNFHVDVQPWERPILACVTLEGEPQAIMNELSTHHMMMAKERGHVWVKDVQFYAEHPKVAERQFLLPQLPEMIAEFLRKLGLSSSRIGVDGSFSALARAAATLPELKLIPSLEGMRTLRWVKHAEELEVMHEAASLSDFVQKRYRDNIRPGRLVQELDYQMAVCMVEEGARRFPGANLEVMRCWTLSGPNSSVTGPATAWEYWVTNIRRIWPSTTARCWRTKSIPPSPAFTSMDWEVSGWTTRSSSADRRRF